MNVFKSAYHRFYMVIAAGVLISSCGEQSVRSSDEMLDVELDSAKTSIINVSGKLFSIPSPIQTAILIRDSKSPYDKSVLNNPQNASKYQTNSLKAINLGVFGTEMAYASLFDDGQSALQYYKAVDMLANDLGIKGAIDQDLVYRLGANAGNSDSLLILSGRFYEEADNYLKVNERFDIAALVLTGGWIESTYLTALTANNGNQQARDRLAEQKTAIKTLSDVLVTATDPEFQKGDILKAIEELQMIFNELQAKYTFREPVTDAAKKTTVIHSESKYEMSDEQLATITEKITALRTQIIQ